MIVALRHGALIAGRLRRDEDLHDPLDLLDSRVDPGRTHFPALPVHPEPGFPIIQAADDQIDLGEQAQAQIRDHIAVYRNQRDLGIQLARPTGGNLRLGLAAVLRPEQHGPRQVRWLDLIQVDHVGRPQAHQREVLQDLVAQGTRADDEDPRIAEPLLPPPGDQPQPVVAILVVDDQGPGIGVRTIDGDLRRGYPIGLVRPAAERLRWLIHRRDPR